MNTPMNYRYFFTLALLLIFSQNSFAQTKSVSANSFLHLKSKTEIVKPMANAAYYKVDGNILKNTLAGGSHIQVTDFPSSVNEIVTLDLKPARSAIDSRTECIVTTATGDIHVTPPEIILYRGKVLGESNSRVILSISNGELLCSILRESGITYIFGPEKNSTEAGAHILLAETDLLKTSSFIPFDCNNDGLIQPKTPTPINELLSNKSAVIQSRNGTLDNGKLLENEIAVEADSQFYGAIGGNVNKTIAYIGALFGMSSMIYENEANITHHLSWIKVWTTSDPYQVHGDAYALPDKVRAYWQANYTSVKRDLAHVLTSISYGGGGFGYYSLCDPAYSYSVSSPQTGHQYPTFAFTYDVYIISHEIGHNFGLVHSHDCYWNPPLDTCYTKDDANLSLGDACFSKPVTPRKSPGTLMSYCANANLFLSGNDFSKYKLEMTFSPRVYAVLRTNAEIAACIEPPKDPIVILLFPRGSDTYNADTTITLKWTYANVANVSLEYSADGGTTWLPIKNNISAASAALAWKVPNVDSKEMLVRVLDAANGTTADTSLMFFTIKALKDSQSPLFVNQPGSDIFSKKIDVQDDRARDQGLQSITWTALSGTDESNFQISFAPELKPCSTDKDVHHIDIHQIDSTKGGCISFKFLDCSNNQILDTVCFAAHLSSGVGDQQKYTLSLEANHPNPFSRITYFNYTIPHTAMVDLSVYDELGKVIALLTHQLQTEGTYTKSFDGSKLASGSYIIRLSFGGKVISRRMVIER